MIRDVRALGVQGYLRLYRVQGVDVKIVRGVQGGRRLEGFFGIGPGPEGEKMFGIFR